MSHGKRQRVCIESSTTGQRIVRVDAIRIIEETFTIEWSKTSECLTPAAARELATRMQAAADELFQQAAEADYQNTRAELRRAFMAGGDDDTQPGAFEGAATAPVQLSPMRMRRAVPLELQTHGKGGLQLQAVVYSAPAPVESGITCSKCGRDVNTMTHLTMCAELHQ